jgi:pilus assembly protein CpaE
MPRVLIIDDEPVYHKMVSLALTPLGYVVDSASNGMEGLKSAQAIQPDLIICDVNMPDINGYEVAKRLRRDQKFAHLPILILTSQAEIQDKLKSFESGADDHVTKPFEPAELAARVGVLIRKAELVKSQTPTAGGQEQIARFIAIHSLRGGIGSSTLATNLALGFTGLWDNPALLLDLALLAGQVALMLNSPLKRTWADVARIKPDELDINLLRSIISKHESGLEFIAAPTSPTEAETLTGDTLAAAVKLFKNYYDYIIADLPHDFSDVTIQALDEADMILLLIAPDLSSVRAAAAALDTYRQLGYGPDKVKLVLNWVFPRHGLAKEKIELALSAQISLVIPFVPDKFVSAINLGQPLLYFQPDEPISALLEDYAFMISKDLHKKVRPAVPSNAWKRVYKRFAERKK